MTGNSPHGSCICSSTPKPTELQVCDSDSFHFIVQIYSNWKVYASQGQQTHKTKEH